ncbi:hypothetical protein [Methylomonas rhizoryzae]|uniref:hypothetical protein n=1 Tax=Methylomonas rhizoryzae TaxID=2608981 RepID=UPI001E58298A|nr:hypothetical protein [Methylomonas rhizoryzae]
MPGFLPENPGVIDVEEVAEIRRLHFVEKVTVSELAKQFKLFRPTIRKHLHTLDEPVYPVRGGAEKLNNRLSERPATFERP